METYCTRPDCSQPINHFSELDDRSELQTAQQKYCNACGMPQILAGRYIPQKLLGKGGFGAAYLACDRHTTKLRQCVVKQFQPSNSFDEKTLKIAQDLFAREAEVLETLGNEHPQIPDLYAFFPLILPEEGSGEKQFFYIVQEYINGETLSQEVARKGKLSEEEVRDVLENMLQVLQFVHEHNSIHRDIKPSNIMRDRAGRLYLLDFGAVKRVTGASTSNYSTGIYSMGFAPPEQMQGRQVYPSTDLYALAATCVRLLTGKPIQELYDSYHNQWTWRKEVEISQSLAALLDRMLLSTPKDRLPSAKAVLKILQRQSHQQTRQGSHLEALVRKYDSLKNNPDQDSGQETIEIDPAEDEVFSQPADWHSLLSLSVENTQPLNQQNWESDSSPVEASEEIPARSTQESTVVQSENEKPIAPPDPEASPATPLEVETSLKEDNIAVAETPASSEATDRDLQPRTKTPHFALWELLATAGFTGLEGALLLIAFSSLFSLPSISVGLWGMSMGGLIYAQWKRLIEKFDFLIIGGITLAVVLFIPPLHNLPSAIVLVIALVASAGAISVTALIRLLYKLFSQ
ncbi:serine/threonine protein kinase [Halothece sp. PCC 7418]|uniref:serine/threonine-protein kinase n=1 Tax=Halothece sp. (strain PCC 7418) TaxID=65093 RepID=UPI0002A080C3|nr:serine/threonine-protein kinase [Halothece sp. PCC 7418]AFZ44877.1 serine/threonine protein kinase [Halothece sp. PCC 7418]